LCAQSSEGVWQAEEGQESALIDKQQQWEEVARHYHALGEELRRTHEEWLQGQTTLLAILANDDDQTSSSAIPDGQGDSTFEAAEAMSQPSTIATRLEDLLFEQVFEAQTPPEAAPEVAAATSSEAANGLTKREQRIAERKRREELKQAAKAAAAAEGNTSAEEKRLQLVHELKSVLARAEQRRPAPRHDHQPRLD
jgi:hypothetical protein